MRVELNRLIGDADAKLKRLSEVEKVFGEVIRSDSLMSGMQAAIDENLDNIEAIFSRIHTPSDFKGLGGSIATLIRKSDGSTAKLSQVSTGQRAAYVLSIFLALNSRLKKAPPLILIDDPIAHVDDLNTLSFLDYLRDVALKNTRQIFFSTANERIAALFERKFDFLGQNFRRFDLPPKLG
jgi:ABC-type lipoprotein export system ATPase subunit